MRSNRATTDRWKYENGKSGVWPLSTIAVCDR